MASDMAGLTHGMDPAQVEELGRFLRSRADELDALARAVEDRLAATTWIGPDADTFRHDWWPAHRSKVNAAAETVRGLGQSALNNASEQRRASDEAAAAGAAGVFAAGGFAGGGGGGGGGGGWGDPSPEEELEALLGDTKRLEELRSLYGFATDEFYDVVKLMREGGLVTSSKIPIVGTLVSAADIGVNQQLHGWGDARTIQAEVDGGVGLLLTPVPGGGLAWSVGTKIGEQASHGIDWIVETTTGDTPAGHIVTNQLNASSPGGNYDALSVDQQAEVAHQVAQRYEGWSGLKNFLWDAAGL